MQSAQYEGSISRTDAIQFIEATGDSMREVLREAQALRHSRTGNIITYSRKVFIPLTRLCRDRCAYCTFAREPKDSEPFALNKDEVLAIARAGERAGCKEALFSLGDKPELRYPQYRQWLQQQGYASTIDYLRKMCELVVTETSLLPHTNAGVLSESEMEQLRPFNASMGMMLEQTSTRLLTPGQAHYQCPDKVPSVRLKTLEAAGKMGVPFTTGILIGIGETSEERVDSLLAIYDLNKRYGHIQEIIIQNFRAKAGTLFCSHSEPDLSETIRTAATARLIFGPEMNIQVPPNLSEHNYGLLLSAGINDWGGISPVTPDFINPEAAWPQISELRAITQQAGCQLRERLTVYPEYLKTPKWVPEALRLRADQWLDQSHLVSPEKEGK
jgi:7,8-didemethyl-8-hydroxy-5-deazariboflavin synthase CofG subunit